MKLTDNPQENFLEELRVLCKKYSTNGEYEYRVNNDRNGIWLKNFNVDVEFKAPLGEANDHRV